jgi:hypothetical protein
MKNSRIAGVLVVFAGMLIYTSCTKEDKDGDKSADTDSQAAVFTEILEVSDIPTADQVSSDELVELPIETFDYLIIHATALEETAQAFAKYRTETGYLVQTVAVTDLLEMSGQADQDTVNDIEAYVRKGYKQRNPDLPFFLLLIGDAVENGNDLSINIPAGFWPGKWQSCFSDNGYADLDSDHVPDLAVGRIPIVDNATGLDVLNRIKKHESEYSVGPWNHRLHAYAGEGGFGEDVDFFIETIAQEGLTAVPYEYDLRFAYNSTGSDFFYAPWRDKVLDMVTSGALLVVFMGHGGGELNVSNLEDIVMHNRQPMIAWFACSTGDFISDWESDAEQVFKQPGGPIATLVSSATTHPYANAVNALELENAFFLEQPKTYGEVIMQMKWLSLYNTSDLREMIDEFAPLYMPESEMPDTVDDHMYSYNLLGDPAVQIRFPMGSVSLEAEDGLLGSELQVTGTVDNFSEGTITIQLMCERATILEELVPIDDPMLEDNWPAVQDNWTKANNYSITSIDIPVAGGSFNGIIEIPENIPAGSYHLAAYAENSQQDAAGSMALKVKKDTQ